MRLRLTPSTPTAVAVACGFVVVVGCVVILGWLFGVRSLTRLLPGLGSMKADTAVCFVLAGISLYALRHEQVAGKMRTVAHVLAATVAAVGILRLTEAVFELPETSQAILGIEPTPAALSPFRMPASTAMNFVLIGSALLLLDRPMRVSQLLALGAGGIALLAMVGWVYGAVSLFRVTRANAMAWHSIASFLVLCTALFAARPKNGFMTLLTSSCAGGTVARQLLPAAVVLPLILSWLALDGSRWLAREDSRSDDAYPIVLGFTLLGLCNAFIFTTLIWFNVAWLHRVDAQRAKSEETLRQVNTGLEERVRARTADLEALNEELEQRVEARTRELAQANQDLLQKNRENELFVYSVSHDLRSPLVNLLGFSKELVLVCNDLRRLLADPRMPADVSKRALAMIDGDVGQSVQFIQTSVARLNSIIEAVLRLSRAGRVEYQCRMVDVQAAVARVVDALKGTISQRGATVKVGMLAPAWGDPTALELVFANLIGNALNYLDPARPGEIEVAAESASPATEAEMGIVYSVKDNGLGIAEAHQQKIFQAFQRLHPEAAPGEGMGLTIVHRIVERHRGKLWVASVPAQGSTFFVALPKPP